MRVVNQYRNLKNEFLRNFLTSLIILNILFKSSKGALWLKIKEPQKPLVFFIVTPVALLKSTFGFSFHSRPPRFFGSIYVL